MAMIMSSRNAMLLYNLGDTNCWVPESILRNTLNWTTLLIETCSPIRLCSHYLGHHARLLSTYGCLGPKLQIICDFLPTVALFIFLGKLRKKSLNTNSTPMKKKCIIPGQQMRTSKDDCSISSAPSSHSTKTLGEIL